MEETVFEIGQIFEDTYPPEAAAWCNSNCAYIAEIDPVDGVRRFQIVGIPEPTEEEQAAQALAEAKAARAAAVAAITVEVDGMVFDGDEKAQERMSRAVVLADSMDETTEWVLHDNTVAIVTADQLRRACKLAGKAQTELWTVPYKQGEEVKEEPQTEVPTGSTGYSVS